MIVWGAQRSNPAFLGALLNENVELVSVDLTWRLHLSDAALYFPAFGYSPWSIFNITFKIKEKNPQIIIYVRNQANEKWSQY